MVATTAESTFIVITAPTTLPRPRHFSNRCIEEAMIPRIARGREMGKTKTVFYGEETGGVGYKVSECVISFFSVPNKPCVVMCLMIQQRTYLRRTTSSPTRP
jgi:hypothetical protein